MSYARRSRATVVVTNSPVSFAIMGPSEVHRYVFIRSDDRNLDLIGLDNSTFHFGVETEIGEKLITFGGFPLPEQRSFIVRTFTAYAEPVSNADNRTSHLSFAWRGLASERDLKQIKKTFSMIAADLAAALHEDTSESAEWQVAPLIALCHSKTNAYIRSAKLRRATVVFALLVYGLIGLAFALNLPFLFDRFSATHN